MIKFCLSLISMGILPMLIICKLYGQNNLVPNGNLETIANCTSWTLIPKPPPTTPWLNFSTNYGTYVNKCANSINSMLGVPRNTLCVNNFQYAHSINGYLAFKSLNSNYQPYVNNARVYQAVKLTDSLKAGKKYACGFYTVLTDSSKYATNNIAMSITKNITYPDTTNGKNGNLSNLAHIYNYGNPIIKDTQNWVLVSSIYTAKGGEQYITIGNFIENGETAIDSTFNNSTVPLAVYCLDDVFVYELNSSYCLPANAGKDTTIKQGDSVFIGSYTNGIDTIRWLNQTTNTIIDSLRPGFWVKPTTTTSYILCQQVNGCATCDTVTVNVTIVPLKFLSFSISPSFGGSAPSPLERVGVRSLWQTANEVNVSHFNLQSSTNGKDFITIGKVKANNKAYNEYSYIDNLQGFQSPSFGGVGEVLYYRIAAIDNDGKMTYSEVKKLTTNHSPLTINIFPNPGKDVVHIIGVGLKQISVVNSLGQIVIQQFVNNNNFTLDVSLLPKGIYMLQMINKQNNVYNEKLIVE